MMDLLVKNARLVTANEVKIGNLAVRDGRIAAILPLAESPEALKTIDLQQKYLLPGAIDDHVHFNDPGYTWREDFPHGSRAAAVGGVTTVLDMPMQNKPAVVDAAVFSQKKAGLQERAYVDYGLWGALIRTNEAALADLQAAGAVAFKCFMCDPGKDYTELRLEEIEERLQILKKFHGLAGFHCEDYAMIREGEAARLAAGQIGRQDYLAARPVEAEEKAVGDILRLVEKTAGRAHICHVSHPQVAEQIRQAKQRGLPVSAETCMHYLLFSEQKLLDQGTAFKCSPPLREPGAAEALWEYVADGTLDCICSDHSPSAIREKEEDGERGTFGAWGGISGVQSSVQLFWDFAVNKKQASPVLIARCLAANPAGIFGLYGRKGALQKGFDADFIVVDAEQEWEITPTSLQYLHPFSAFCGCRGKGLPVMTFLRGRMICDHGRICGSASGRWIHPREKSEVKI